MISVDPNLGRGGIDFYAKSGKGEMMEEKQLKKFLAGLCIAGLLSGAAPTVGCAEEGKSG